MLRPEAFLIDGQRTTISGSASTSRLVSCSRLARFDTAPAKIELIEPGIAVADFVLIPVRPSAFDIEQAAICVELCESHGKAHAFVLNHAQPGKLTKSSVQFLRQNGSTVIETPITMRQAYMAATTVGKSGPEVEKAAWPARKSTRCGMPSGSYWLKRCRDVGSRRRGHDDPGQVWQTGHGGHPGSPSRPREGPPLPLIGALAQGAKSRQLNLKVRPEIHERVSALALDEGV